MAIRPKAVIESRNGEKFSPITIAKNVLTDDGQNLHDILSDRKEDMMTPTIENSSSMFKVGQGDNVDYSSNVVSGAYESMILKGKTMVNCIQEPSSQDVVLPYEFTDSQCVTINDTKESGALGVELKGQTLVNLWKKHSTHNIGNFIFYDDGFMETKPNVRYFDHIQKAHTNMIKPNTKYLLIIEVEKNTLPVAITYQPDARTFFNSATNQPSVLFEPKQIGRATKILTSISDLSSTQEDLQWGAYIQFAQANYASEEQGIVKIRQMLLEYQEGMENWDIPYFDGMTSVKMPTLHTVGKNLFDINNESNLGSNYTKNGNSITCNATSAPIFGFNGLDSNKSYTIAFDYVNNNEESTSNSLAYAFSDEKRIYSSSTSYNVKLKGSYTLGQTTREVYVLTNKNAIWVQGGKGATFSNIQIEEGSIATSYEPYKSSILSLPEEVELHKVGDIEDTLNCNTGEYVQRIREVVFNGSEYWTYSGDHVSNEEYVVYHAKITDPINSSNLGVANNLPYDREAISTTMFTKECVYINSAYQVCYIRIKRERSGIVDYLTSNPLTVQYELATPIVTKINLPSTLKSWNTTTHIYSEIPENTLYPILSHSNPSYPVILKPSTKYSIVANSYSNNHINSTIKFNLGGATASTTVGNRVTTITTPSTLSNELLTMSGRGNKLNSVMVIEGDVVGDESYFEGMCDCKSPILSNTGLTLYESPFEKVYGEGVSTEFFNMMDLAPYVDKWGINKNYTFSFDIKANKSGTARIYFQNGASSRHNFEFRVPVTTEYVRHTVTTRITGTDYNWKESRLACFTTYNTGCFATIKNVQFALGTSVEPYKSNTTTFNQKDGKTIVLRSLPNGVCDTLNVETGEYVQRIGEVVLDGSENWAFYGATGEGVTTAFKLSLTGHISAWMGGNGHCDRLKFVSGDYIYRTNNEGITTDANNFVIRVLNEKASTIEELKSYLKTKPLTVQYELATPIVSTVDIQGFPYAYTNGHVQLSSGSIGQSLTPKVEYSVVTNHNGQIRSNQKMVERHQKQLDRLQAMILTNLINTQYEQALTNLKYDLKNVREEVK